MIVASPSDAADENARQLTAVMVREADGPEGLAAHLNDPRVRACVVGPGCGVGPETRAKTVCVLETSARLVADADALTSFAEAPGALFARLRADDALTPQGGEFARLFPDLDPQTDKVGAARAAAARAGAVVVLKGADTVIASPDGRVAINANAAPDLATAGAGDVLAGFIAGLGAQGMAGFEAAAAGVWLHGEAGSAAGPGLIAEDLPEAIPHVLRRLFSPDAGARAEPSAPEDDGARGP